MSDPTGYRGYPEQQPDIGYPGYPHQAPPVEPYPSETTAAEPYQDSYPEPYPGPYPDQYPAGPGGLPPEQRSPRDAPPPQGYPDTAYPPPPGYAEQQQPFEEAGEGWDADPEPAVDEEAPTSRKLRRKRHRQRRKGSAALVLSLVVLAAGLGGGGYYGFLFVRDTIGPGADYDGPGNGESIVEVEKGDTTSRIGERLQADDVVRSSRAFVVAASNNPRGNQVQPGAYKLRKQMRAAEALNLLLDAKSRLDLLTVPEGLWVSETFGRIDGASEQITLAGLEAAAKNPAAVGLPSMARGNYEGFLFPSRYELHDRPDAARLLQQMTGRFTKTATDLDLVNKARSLGRSPYEIVVVASLVQAEARHQEDMGKVARVIYNRLAGKQTWQRKLQFDSTLNYLSKKRNKLRWTTREWQALVSPYNTYLNPGLPPGPICNPGENALRAALEPTPGDWLYFVTVNPSTGQTKFTADYGEFQQLKEEYKQNYKGN